MKLSFLEDLRRKFFFRDFSIDEMLLLFEDAKYREIGNHKTLFTQGQEAQAFAVVVYGGFKIIKETKIKENTIIHFGIPGDLLGAMFMTHSNGYFAASVVALGPSAALEVSKSIYLKNWDGNPKVSKKLKAHFYQRIQELQEHHVLSRRPLKEKIALLLLQLVREEIEQKVVSIPVPITRQEIADYVGSSVESVIRNLSSMTDVVSTKDRSITILDLPALRRIVGGEFS